MNDLMKDEILGMTITHNLEVSVPNEGWAIMLVRSRQEFYERVGLLHVDQIRDNPGRLPFTAFRTSPGEILDEVKHGEVHQNRMYLDGATTRVIRLR